MHQLADSDLLGFLQEDLARGDVTSEALVPPGALGVGVVLARQRGLLAGVDAALGVARLGGVEAEALLGDGAELSAGLQVLRLAGAARAILGVERTMLNLLAHLSGVASATRVVAVALAGTGTRVAATRKTLPGLRRLQKRAVIVGGGTPHRFDLGDAVLIKDNHLAVVGDVAEAVCRAREACGPTEKIEIEVETEREALAAAKAGADILLLDNMSPAAVRSTVSALVAAGLRDRLQVEASGGITATTALDYARAGADLVSMSALTLSAMAIDFSLELKGSEPAACSEAALAASPETCPETSPEIPPEESPAPE